MSTTLEELKKIISEQEAALLIKAKQQQLNLMEQQAFEKLQMRLIDDEGIEELPSVDILHKIHKQPNPFEIQTARDKSIQMLFANFAREFGKENIHNNSLAFIDDDDENSKANTFFQSQSNQGYAFLFKQVDSDNYSFSNGKGQYKMGTKADIIFYCKQNLIELPQSFKEKTNESREILSSSI
ncbi:MAG: hypothetical protein HYX60_09085 [Legionella longbeachae]|nr:hypothetical protein [Legionella longbeachae]